MKVKKPGNTEIKIEKAFDLGSKATKAIIGLGVSVTMAVITEKVTDMNGAYIDKRVQGIKKEIFEKH
jgi:hypothetical protein